MKPTAVVARVVAAVAGVPSTSLLSSKSARCAVPCVCGAEGGRCGVVRECKLAVCVCVCVCVEVLVGKRVGV